MSKMKLPKMIQLFGYSMLVLGLAAWNVTAAPDAEILSVEQSGSRPTVDDSGLKNSDIANSGDRQSVRVLPGRQMLAEYSKAMPEAQSVRQDAALAGKLMTSRSHALNKSPTNGKTYLAVSNAAELQNSRIASLGSIADQSPSVKLNAKMRSTDHRQHATVQGPSYKSLFQ